MLGKTSEHSPVGVLTVVGIELPEPLCGLGVCRLLVRLPSEPSRYAPWDGPGVALTPPSSEYERLRFAAGKTFELTDDKPYRVVRVAQSWMCELYNLNGFDDGTNRLGRAVAQDARFRGYVQGSGDLGCHFLVCTDAAQAQAVLADWAGWIEGEIDALMAQPDPPRARLKTLCGLHDGVTTTLAGGDSLPRRRMAALSLAYSLYCRPKDEEYYREYHVGLAYPEPEVAAAIIALAAAYRRELVAIWGELPPKPGPPANLPLRVRHWFRQR